MEHIVQFAINFDDQRITEMVEERAEKEITASLEQKVCDRLFKTRYYGGKGDPKEGFNNWMNGQVENFLDAHKQEIIEMAGRFLADRLLRTKAAKEMIGGLKDGSQTD